MSSSECPPEVVAEALPRLLRSLGANVCTFYELPMPARVEQRGRNSRALLEASELARQRKRTNDSFIETLLEVSAEEGLTREILDAAGFHQPMQTAIKRYDQEVRRLTSERIEELCAGVSRDSMLVMSSLVLAQEGVRHLPMLDFKFPRNSENDRAAIAVGEFAGGGMILSSGSSYHFYGEKLMRQQEFEDWLLRCQLLSRYVDGRWVTHQLMERQAALRVSHLGRSEPPTVIAHARQPLV